jgi:hypothetical protein
VANEVNLREYTKKEFVRCALDPIYFIRRYCYIQEPIRGRMLFDLYDYQEKAVKDFQNHKYNVILKGRQIGISTAVAAYALWLMLFHKDKNVLIIATKQDIAKVLVTKVRFAFENLPIWLQVPCTENNKLSLKFSNGSQIIASSAAGDAGRSMAISLLVFDEAAFVKNAKEIWVATQPTLSTGGHAVLISTPNGVGNFFHKIYTDATAGVSGEGKDGPVRWNPIKLDWRVRYSQEWRDEMGRDAGERAARQEYDAEFIGSGNTVIDSDLIELYASYIANQDINSPHYSDTIEKTGFDGNVWVWEHPDFSRNYMVVADVARGDGSDFSAFHIIDLESNAQVAEYKGKIGTTEFAHMLYEWATRYKDALLVVERENVGWAVLQTIIDRGYKNLFYMSKDRKVVEVERNIINRYNAEEKKLVPGFGTTISTRPLIISKLDTYMREVLRERNDEDKKESRAVIIRSMRLIDELRVFIWENNKAQAQEGYNDDLVMSLGIGLWVRDTALKLHQEGINITRTALDGIRRSSTALPDALYTPNHLNHDPYKIQMGNTNPKSDENLDEDIRWLLG